MTNIEIKVKTGFKNKTETMIETKIKTRFKNKTKARLVVKD